MFFGKTIVRTAIISDDARKSATSSVIRGGVGATLGLINPVLGAAGLVGGVMSGKNKKNTTFLIEYSDGSRETKVVKTNSSEFKKLAKYISM